MEIVVLIVLDLALIALGYWLGWHCRGHEDAIAGLREPRTGAERYFHERMKNPLFASEYFRARQDLAEQEEPRP